MRITRMLYLALAVLLAGLLGPRSAAAAEYPSKPIHFLIPFGAGGSADVEGRLLAKEMSKILGQPVVPINKPGGGGAVTYTALVNAKPDGYTVAWNSTSVLTSTNIGNVPFDYKAMDHIGRVEYQPMVFAVKADAKWKTYKDFVADCRKHPGTYKAANGGTGSATHLAAVAIVNAAKCKVIHLPVGVKRRNATVLSGEAQAMVGPLTGVIKLAQAKKIRLLAITSAERNPLIPDVPTATELGYKAEIDLFRGLSVPKGTPALVKAKLADAMMRAARSDAFMKFAEKNGFTVAPLSPTPFSKYLSDMNIQVSNVMKSAGLYQSKKKK